MRTAVFALAILGALGLLGVGIFAAVANEALLAPGLRDTVGRPTANEETYDQIGYQPRLRAGIFFMLAAGAFAVLAAFLALKGRGKTAAALLLVPLAGPLMPVVVAFTRPTPAPLAVAMFLFMFAALPMALVFLAGLLSFFVQPAPAGGPPLAPRRPRRPRDDDE